MKVSVKNQGKCEKLLTIEIPADRVRSEYDKVYADLSKKVNIPGFRPGKAPREILVARYSGDARSAVLENLLEESTRAALKQESIDPIYYPSINKVDFEGEKLSFEALVEVRPEVKLGNYKGLKAKQNPVSIGEKEIEDAMERIRESFAKFIPVEDRGVEMGDFVVADVDYETEGAPKNSHKDDWMEVNTKKIPEDLARGLVGMRSGESRDISVKFPKDFALKDQAGKSAKFHVALKEIKKRELPALTDEWVLTLGEMKTVEDLKNRVREDIQKEKEHSEEVRFENELIDGLLKEAKLDLTQGAIERRLKSLLESSKERFKKQGFPDEEIAKREEKIKEDLKKEAEKQVKLRFIFEEIVKLEKIQVENSDLEAHYQKMVQSSGVAVEKVKKYYQESEERFDTLLNELATGKILKVLKDNAKP